MSNIAGIPALELEIWLGIVSVACVVVGLVKIQIDYHSFCFPNIFFLLLLCLPIGENGDDLAVKSVGQGCHRGQDPENGHNDEAVRRPQSTLQGRQNDPIAVDGDSGHSQGRNVNAHDLNEGHQGAKELAKWPMIEQDSGDAERDIEASHQKVRQGHIHQECVGDAAL
jgi:hypothetical protein